jgi:hypothetical protein
MALNLSTLTSPATSADVLAEVLTTADFLEPCPVLRNLARGSNKGGDAKQTVGTQQPKALPLIDGDGYLYVSGVNGNYAKFDEAVLPNNTNFDVSIDFYYGGPVSLDYDPLFSQYNTSDPNRFFIYIRNNGTLGIFWANFSDSTLVVTKGRHTVRFVKSGSTITVYLNGVQGNSLTHSTDIAQTQTTIGDNPGLVQSFKGAIFRVTEANSLFNCDFTATNVRHGDTKFKCATGQVVTINKSGNDPATVIKKSVLRFDGADDFMDGLLNQTITGGYMFAAFSVLGDGGEGNSRVFSVNPTGALDWQSGGVIFSGQNGGAEILSQHIGGWRANHVGLFEDGNGDILHESFIESGNQVSRVNNADEASNSITHTISAEEFNIGCDNNGTSNPSIDLEFLAVFPASITDAQADDVRKYINNRNNVFLRHDTDGFYFFDGAATTDGQVFSGSSSWLGRIVGSDNDDPFKYLSNGSINDRPTTDGYKITFADNSDHFLFNTPLSNGLAGWQVVGTSLGTFAYRVDNDAVTELNLLGNAGLIRSIGDLYGIILLPASATGNDIEQARKLLIDRGASDAVSASSVQQFWQSRNDIVEFKQVDASSVTSFREGWRFCASLEIFPPLQAPNCINFLNAWEGNSSLNSFGAIDASSGTTFSSAWKSCSSLTSFPAGAKLGTEASGVNFSQAWKSSGLTSFSTPLPTATTLTSTWQQCTSLTSFSTELPTATRVDYAWWGDNSLSDFRTTDIKNSTNFTSAWQNCSALSSFPADAKLGTSAQNVNFSSAWLSSGLTSFSTPLPTATLLNNAFQDSALENFNLISLPEATSIAYTFRNTNITKFNTSIPKATIMLDAWRFCDELVDFSEDVFADWSPSSIHNTSMFLRTWSGCTALSSKSVENILVGISNANVWPTLNAQQGGTPISNPQIDIDYNGDPLSAATNAAIRSLDTKGWEVYINGEIRTGVELLDLQGFYFFESEGLAAANVASWDSSIGASTASLDLVVTQTDGNDQPVADGTVVTFADNTDHLEWTGGGIAGVMVVGTSIGTFSYRITGGQTPLQMSLLGNITTSNGASYKQAGSLYGLILLPLEATTKDVQEARQLLIDRGASAGSVGTDITSHFRERTDIVVFDNADFSGVTIAQFAWRFTSNMTTFNVHSMPDLTDAYRAWSYCSALESFNTLLPAVTNAREAWSYCSSLSSFGTTEISNCTNFISAWHGCSSLTSFPADAKLGTSAQNVNFSTAWMNSGLTSFSALDLSSGNNFSNTFRGTAITQFPSGALLGTAETNVNFNSAFRSSNIISFSTPLPTGNTFADSFKYCDDLTDVSVDVFTNWNPLSIANACFNDTWKFCTALTAQSVENILTSINASGKHGTSDGTSGGTPLADAGIDIDYNVSTGSLSAATNTAIDSLSGKGWEVYINGVLVIPNILDLEPAAAYSLRSFDADADPNVVNVRRSSDNATSDFKASEVSDGTLTSWVNTDVDFVTPTLNNGDFEDGLTGWGFWSASADTNEFYAGTQSAKITVIGGGGAYIYKNNFSLQAGANYRVGFWAKISDASKQARVEFGSASNKEDISFTSTDWEYKEVTKTATAVTLAFNRQTGSGDYTINIDNVTVTQLTADGHVTTWYDQGGTNHAAQSDDAKQPKIVDGGTLVTDGSGNPAIIGDGVNDTLFHPTLTQSLDNTDFLVTAAYKNSLALGVSGGVPRLYMTQGAWSYNNLSSITFSNQSGRNVLSFQTNGDAQEVFGNGTSLGTGSEAQANFAFNGFNLMQAGSGFSNGFFMEVVVFDENQVSNRTGIENNINDTYTIY